MASTAPHQLPPPQDSASGFRRERWLSLGPRGLCLGQGQGEKQRGGGGPGWRGLSCGTECLAGLLQRPAPGLDRDPAQLRNSLSGKVFCLSSSEMRRMAARGRSQVRRAQVIPAGSFHTPAPIALCWLGCPCPEPLAPCRCHKNPTSPEQGRSSAGSKPSGSVMWR